jgi:type II secretory pathway pseudopilin PulG
MPARLRFAAGLTLIELVMVILVLGIASVGLVAMAVQLPRSLGLTEDLQAAAQLAQGCAEHILASRRHLGYAATATDCATLPPLDGYGPPAVVRTPNWTGAGCPTGASCTHYRITASYGTTGANSVVEFFVVDY